MSIFICSDWHLYHDRPFIYEPRGFTNVEEHNSTIIANHNSIVGPEDEVYVLGDCGFGEDMSRVIELIRQMNGKKHLIIGNHDSDKKINLFKEANIFEDIQFGCRFRYKKIEFWLTHYPMDMGNYEDPKPVWNIHGHTHSKEKINERNYNVSPEAHNCYPISLDNIYKEIKEKKYEAYLSTPQ